MNAFPMIEPNMLPLPKRITVARIQEVVAEYFGIAHTAILSPRREWNISHPRQIAMYLARELTVQSLPDIGRRFGRDHSTIIFACRAVEARVITDSAIAQDVATLRQALTYKRPTEKMLAA